MTTVTFDTHKFVTTKDSLQESDLVTNQHLSLELERTKSDMIKWVAGLLLAQAALIAALVKIL
ncbi:MAG: DUF1640 domain-containing protein [Gammaproteobacteria bacterium]|nr:DUF1640 domain-containing protein [Gammaproteobacteria bacterium]